MSKATIVWFRHDLRVADNPALNAAATRGGPVVPVFIHSPGEQGAWATGAAARVWLHGSLAALDAQLRSLGSRLLLAEGASLESLAALVEESGADVVYWNRRYEPAGVAVDTQVKEALKAAGVEARSFKAGLLFEPHEVSNKSGRPFRVFTPFWKHLRTLGTPPAPLLAPARLAAPANWPTSVELNALGLEPDKPWVGGIKQAWQFGEAAAHSALGQFVEASVAHYGARRDRPALAGTSRLSPRLHFGELSPRQVWGAVEDADLSGAELGEPYLRQLAWRDFGHHLLFNNPHTPDVSLDERFAAFPWWRADQRPEHFSAWKRGATGYPLVDAGMRELYTTGWMHNRVRMVVASLLVKHLLIRWQDGARWFWHTLVDANLANNTMGWQWAAGCGADAAPYFRVFNPTLQAERFDAAGEYIRRWVPELAELPDKHLAEPAKAPAMVRKAAGVEIGADYPAPIVEHKSGRANALAALETLKQSA